MVTPIVYANMKERSVYFPGDDELWYQFSIDPKTGKVNLQ